MDVRVGLWRKLSYWCFWAVVLEKTLESPLDCKEIQPVHSEGDQPWDFFGGNDAKADTPVLWPPHAKSWLSGKDSGGTTQRDDMGREEGGGFRMGNTCIPVADSFWYLANLIQLCKVKKKKKREKKKKDSDAGRDWGQEEKGTREDGMAGWHHRLDGHEFEWTPGVSDGQGGLACCNSWGHKESDTTEGLNWTDCYGSYICSLPSQTLKDIWDEMKNHNS